VRSVAASQIQIESIRVEHEQSFVRHLRLLATLFVLCTALCRVFLRSNPSPPAIELITDGSQVTFALEVADPDMQTKCQQINVRRRP
jgi:hypothetical protein